jgi:glycosyltransferase involved in cell wall biosynthesis
MNPPTVSIVIPTLEEERQLPFLLSDLAAQTLRPLEVIVVDGGSTDNTRALVQAAGATVIAHSKGVGGQRTAGGEAARGDIIVFMDADVRVAPDALQRMITSFTQRQYDAACPWFWPHNSTIAIRGIFAVLTTIFWLMQRIAPSGAGCCIVVTKTHFARTGGFQARYTYDDISFIRRAGRLGRFGILPVRVEVSDRRFRKDGTLKVCLTYALLCPFFLFGLFGAANFVKYRFAHYAK